MGKAVFFALLERLYPQRQDEAREGDACAL